MAHAIAHRNDRFITKRVPAPWLAALDDRDLPRPRWDPGERLYAWEDDPQSARAVRFLHEGHHVALDDAATERIEELVGADELRPQRQRLHELEQRLRPYQRDGVAFLVDKRKAFLADGMGLGKTLQALFALEKLGAYPVIVVCPASVKLSWKAEVLKWMPWRSLQVLQTGRDMIGDVDIVILNPELLMSTIEDLLLHGPVAVVLDEAHLFKNPAAQRSQLAEELADMVDIRFALTGTPIPNRRPDIIQQLRLIGQLENVLHIYRGVLPHWWTQEQGPLRHDHAMQALETLPRRELNKRLRETCFLRRTKEQVHEELPAFHRTRRDLVLDASSGYRREEESFVDWVRRLRKEHPDGWGAGQRMQGRQHLSRLRREAALSKISAVVEWATDLGGERVVYFAHHKEVVRELAKALRGLPGRGEEGKAKIAVITGDVPAPQRQAIIHDLSNYDGLVATMDASGQGVDGMQVHARHVVFIELDWTPTKHEQCEGRLHRIGQQDRVEAWYFTAQDSIDQAMMRRLDEKWRELQGILEGEEESVDRFVGDVMDRAAQGVAPAALWR